MKNDNMIGSIIAEIQDICNRVAPGAVFECDEVRMLNIKVDTVTRTITVIQGGVATEVSNSFIYIEEPTYAMVDIPNRGFQKQRTPIRLYFCKFEPLHNDALKGTSGWSNNSIKPDPKRIQIRSEIEETMVRPFLYELKNSELGMRYPAMLESVRLLYPRSRFDANEVSVGLEITYTEDWCIEQYKP